MKEYVNIASSPESSKLFPAGCCYKSKVEGVMVTFALQELEVEVAPTQSKTALKTGLIFAVAVCLMVLGPISLLRAQTPNSVEAIFPGIGPGKQVLGLITLDFTRKNHPYSLLLTDGTQILFPDGYQFPDGEANSLWHQNVVVGEITSLLHEEKECYIFSKIDSVQPIVDFAPDADLENPEKSLIKGILTSKSGNLSIKNSYPDAPLIQVKMPEGNPPPLGAVVMVLGKVNKGNDEMLRVEELNLIYAFPEVKSIREGIKLVGNEVVLRGSYKTKSIRVKSRGILTHPQFLKLNRGEELYIYGKKGVPFLQKKKGKIHLARLWDQNPFYDQSGRTWYGELLIDYFTWFGW